MEEGLQSHKEARAHTSKSASLEEQIGWSVESVKCTSNSVFDLRAQGEECTEPLVREDDKVRPREDQEFHGCERHRK